MKKTFGSIYFLMLSYRFETILFWIINSSILLSFALLAILFEDNIKLYVTISAPLYVFIGIQSAFILKKSLSFLLRMGISRMQYAAYVSIFVLLYSIWNSAIVTLFHFIFNTLEKTGLISHVSTIHPANLIMPQSNYVHVFVFDFVLLLFITLLGLIVTIVFHRLGKIGGFSLLGIAAFIFMIAVALEWFTDLYMLLKDNSFFINMLYLFITCMVLAGIYCISLRKISIVANSR